MAGARAIAEWVLDGSLPEGEDCPFGCDAWRRLNEELAGQNSRLEGRLESQREQVAQLTSLLDGAVRGIILMAKKEIIAHAQEVPVPIEAAPSA